MNAREIVPNSEVIERLISVAIRPVLEAMARDTDSYVSVKTSVYSGAEEMLRTGILNAGTNGCHPVFGNLRLRFREAFNKRIQMHAEAVFDRENAVANCSGFSLKAEYREGEVKKTAFTVRYSVWNWTGWV